MYLYHIGFVERYKSYDIIIGSKFVSLEHEIATLDDLDYIRKRILEASKTNSPVIVSMTLVSSSFTDKV